MLSPSLSTTPNDTRADAAPAARGERAAADSDQSAANVLLVEPDPLQREMLLAGLGLYDRRLRTLAVAHSQAAMRVLETRDVDLVITELAFPEQPDAGDYLDRLRLLAPRVPILALTRERATIVSLRARVDALVRKPAEMDDLLRTAQALLARRRESVVRGLTLEGFLQMLHMERKSCTVTASVRGRQGRIALRQGRVVAAEAEGLQGKEAVFLLLSWIAPVLSVVEACEAAPTFDASVQELLLEHFVNQDHQRRL